MRKLFIYSLSLAIFLSASGCGKGDSTPAASSGADGKAVAPADVQKQLEQISPPASGKTAKKK